MLLGPAPAGTRQLTIPLLATGDRITANGSVSILLVRSNAVSPAAAITVGNDYDGNNDGVFDVQPLRTATVLDAIGWRGGGSEMVYPNDWSGGSSEPTNVRLQLSDTGNKADEVTRFPGNFTPLAQSAWYGGDLVNNSPDTPGGTAYDTTAGHVTANFPVGGALTPGAANGPASQRVISYIAPQSGVVNEANPSIPFTVDAANAGNVVVPESNNPDVVPNDPLYLSVTGSGTARNVVINRLRSAMT
jgi:hypothetical protein